MGCCGDSTTAGTDKIAKPGDLSKPLPPVQKPK